MDLKIDTDFNDILSNCSSEQLDKYLNLAKIDLVKTHDGRVLYTTNLFDTSTLKYKIRYQTKGLILDELDNSIISIAAQPHSYYNNINKSILKKLYEEDNYSLVKARDGTTITIYNFDSTYYMSTGRSSDITNYYWNEDKTFAEMFYESAQTNPQFMKDTDLILTDTGYIKWNIPQHYCVTIGFRHHNIHRNRSDNDSVWFIYSYNKNTKKEEIPSNLSCLIANEYENEKIKWPELIEKCNRSQLVDQKENFYGYILTAKNTNIPIHLQKVFIPSILYQTLQHFFYSFNKNNDDILTHKNRYIYSIFRNILLNNNNFLTLLYQLDPNYQLDVMKYNNFINTIIPKISLRFQDSDSNTDNEYSDFIMLIHDRIKKDEHDFNINDSIAYKVISDYIRNISNSSVLCDLYLKNN